MRQTIPTGLIPRHLPTWQMMHDDLGRPTAAEVSKLLGVSLRTVYGWNRAGQAPRTAMLAVFWLTSWGRSATSTHLENGARVLQSLTESLNNENAGLRLRIARLEQTGDFGAANQPVAERAAPHITAALWELAPETAARVAAGR